MSVPAVLLAIISVQCGAAIAKTLFPTIGAAGTASMRIGISALILLLAYRPNLREISREQWKIVIPAYGLLSDEQVGLDQFVKSVSDIKLFLRTYSHSGN